MEPFLEPLKSWSQKYPQNFNKTEVELFSINIKLLLRGFILGSKFYIFVKFKLSAFTGKKINVIAILENFWALVNLRNMIPGQIKRGRASTPFSSPSSTCGKNEAKVIPIYHCINQCFSCKFTLKIILWEKFHISSCKYQNDKKFQEFKTSQTSNSPKAVVATLQKCKQRDIRPCVPQPLCSLYSNVPTCIFYIGKLGFYTFLHFPSSFGEFQSHQLAQLGKKLKEI